MRFVDEGDSIEGFLVGVIPSEDDDFSDVLVLQNEEGELIRAYSSKKLADSLLHNGAIKEKVLNRYCKLTFKEKKKIKGGKSFKDFSVLVWPDRVCQNPNPLV